MESPDQALERLRQQVLTEAQKINYDLSQFNGDINDAWTHARDIVNWNPLDPAQQDFLNAVDEFYEEGKFTLSDPAKRAVIVELEWLNSDFSYVWYVLLQGIHEDLMEEGEERGLIHALDSNATDILAKFGGPGDWELGDEEGKAEKWCKDNGYEVIDVHEMAADREDMD